MPRVGHGKWDLMAVIPWYMEQIEKHANPRDKTTEEAQRRYYLARAGLTEHKEAESKGQAVSLAEHKAVVSELCADIADTIEAFPVREYTQPDERERAFRICNKLRQRLSESVAKAGMVGGKRSREPTASATADSELEPMGGGEPDAATA